MKKICFCLIYFLLGVAALNAQTLTTNLKVVNLNAYGFDQLNSQQTITVDISNIYTVTASAISVTLTISGANTYSASQTIATLAPGDTTSILFNGYSPTARGDNTITVSLPPDLNNNDNTFIQKQRISCDTFSLGPPLAASWFTQLCIGNGVIIALKYNSPGTPVELKAMGCVTPSFSAAGNLGKSIYPVLCDATGSVIATGNTVTITNALMNVFSYYKFATPQLLAPNTTYYFGIRSLGGWPVGITSNSQFNNVSNNWIAINNLGAINTYSMKGYTSLKALFYIPSLSITSTNSIICMGESATLTATGANSYTWSTGSNDSSIVVAPTGSIYYTLTGTNTCGNYSTSYTLSVDLCTGLPDQQKSDLNIIAYPSISEGKFFVKLENGGSAAFRIFNIAGQNILSGTLRDKVSELDISNENKGLYFLEVDQDGPLKRIKLIKE